MLTPKVLSETARYFVVSKPSGWVTTSSEPDQKLGNLILQDWVRSLPGHLASIEARNGIVHRLDKPTSGIVLIARDLEAYQKLQEMFAKHLVAKEYVALVHDKLLSESLVDAPIGRLSKNRTKFGVVEEGREAKTTFIPLEYFEHDGWLYTKVLARPQTGRTHQIRVHLAHIKHPIVADLKYVGRKRYKADLRFCPRLFLHAAKIEFTDPFTNSPVQYRSDLPYDLAQALENISHIN